MTITGHWLLPSKPNVKQGHSPLPKILPDGVPGTGLRPVDLPWRELWNRGGMNL